MHHHFNGIETNPICTPSFIIHYVNHSANSVECPTFSKDASDNVYVVNNTIKRQETEVNIIFRDTGFFF
jgi:hypothetical protein